MDEFRTIARIWPTGDELDVGEDSNVTSIPSTFTRNAANFVPNPDGGDNYQFLFWDTGRRITGKRRVRWNFSVGGWGVWTATRWYGIPGDGIGQPRLTVTPYSIHLDRALNATAIDPAASTLNGASPLGLPAWPSGGNTHVVDTTHGPVTLGAVSPLTESGATAEHAFTGWLKLNYGGDTSGEFVETDVGFDPSNTNSTSFYTSFGSGTYSAPTNDSGELVAAYGKVTSGGGFGGLNPDILRELLEGLQEKPGIDDIRDWVFDPSPIDRLRLAAILELVQKARSTPAASAAPSFDTLAARARTMSKAELRKSVTEVKATLKRGEATLKSLEVALNRASASSKKK